jgi:RIO kinase 1
LRNFFGNFVPQLLTTRYGAEIWKLYQAGLLTPETVLTGRIAVDKRPADVGAVMRELQLARQEEQEQRRY